MSARYLAHEAGHLAGVAGDRIGQWARWGHIRASISAEEPHVYAWEDVAEAHEKLGFTEPVVDPADDAEGPVSGGVSDDVVADRVAERAGQVL